MRVLNGRGWAVMMLSLVMYVYGDQIGRLALAFDTGIVIVCVANQRWINNMENTTEARRGDNAACNGYQLDEWIEAGWRGRP